MMIKVSTMILISALLLIFAGSNFVFAVNKEDPGANCTTGNSGKTVVVNDLEGNERALICLKHDGKYHWKELDNNPSVGEYYNPGKDCSDIVRRRRSAKTGSYWINGLGLNRTLKVWCDVKTDKGGFMLVGNKNSPISWTVPSNSQIVTPNGPPHWSSNFGDAPMIEFRVQVSTTNDPTDIKADWLYHFTNPRPFTKLFVSDNGSGCRNHFPGIGHVAFVKDLLVGKVVTRNFQCSRFGPAYPTGLGWQMMNNCLKTHCQSGYAVISGINLRYDKYGGFSFSTSFPRSGIRHNSTAFVGCDNEKCCFCYGPKGSVGDHCSPGCKSINGGRVTKAAHIWFWIRTSIPPSPVWKKCAEFKKEMSDGNNETYFIHPVTGVVKKGTCSKNGMPKVIDGIVDVKNKKELQKLPRVQGLLSYRDDNKKLYVANGDGWDALGRENVEKNLSRRLSEEKAQLISEINQLKIEFRNETRLLRAEIQNLKLSVQGKSCLDIKIRSKIFARSGVYLIRPYAGSSRFEVYCDMETHSGGWTLVYSYTFTNYNSFSSGSNAVTPRPNWYAPTANVPISTTPPLSETTRGAVDYSLWKYIGNDVLIKSNINDWIVCQPNGGSLVTRKDGSMRCQNIKHVAPKCHNPPSKIYWINPGPTFDKYLYFFAGQTSRWCPTHDFCNSCSGHKKSVPNPGGAIYLR